MPVSSQLSGLASIWSEVIEIISTILLNYPSVLPLGALLCLVITKWYLYHRHHHHYHRHRHGVSSLFIISAAHWSLFFLCAVKLWSQISRNYYSDQRIFHRFLCQQKTVCSPPCPQAPHPTPSIIITIFSVSPLSHLTHRPTPLLSSQTNHIRTCSVLKMSNSAKISRQQQQQQLVLVVCSLCTLCLCVWGWWVARWRVLGQLMFSTRPPQPQPPKHKGDSTPW